MASRILIIDERILSDMLEMADYLLDTEHESFHESSHELIPAAGHSGSELESALSDYEASDYDSEAGDDLAAISEGHIFCNTVRVWKKLREFY